MTDTPTLTGVDIGEAQRAVGAVLDSLLAEIETPFATWVAVNVLATAPAPLTGDALVCRLVSGLKLDSAVVEAAVAELSAAGLVRRGSVVELTAAGRDLHRRVSDGIAAVTPQLYGGIPQSDLATAHRVLRTVTDRANAYLAH
jgi:DNA-binding MarR family transcriptional regulator